MKRFEESVLQKLMLASSSPYRRELLSRLGVSFTSQSPDVDERRHAGEKPEALASRLARAKAEAVAQTQPDAFVIGSDQVICVDDEVLNKPGTVAKAERQLARLSGSTHQLITAVCVVAPSGVVEEVCVHQMAMRALTEEEIASYVAEDQPLDCAGSYKIEAGGIRLFESLEGPDYTSIIGLPLTVVRRLLDVLGFDWEKR